MLSAISVASYYDKNTGTRDGAVSVFSSRGHRTRPSTWPDISAPGEDITSSCRLYHASHCAPNVQVPGRHGPGPADLWTFASLSGTSMAAPHVSGIVAQLFQAKPTATPEEVEHALKATAHKFTGGAAYETVGPYTSSYDKGTGLVDIVAAVKALRGNRVVNGSFESSPDGLSPTGWTGGVGTGYDTSGRYASHGTDAVSITGQGGGSTGRWTSAPMAVTGGETYGLAATIATALASSGARVAVEVLNTAGTVVGKVTGITSPLTGDQAATELAGVRCVLG